MKVRILACFLLLSGCHQADGMANFAAPDSNDTIDDGAGVLDGWDSPNAIDMPHITPEEHARQLARIRRDAAESARKERWRQSVLPTLRNAFPKIGTCYPGRISEIVLSHWQDDRRSGSHFETLDTWRWEKNPYRYHGNIWIPYGGSIEYTNGIRQSLDDGVWTKREPPPFAFSRVGDRVLLCVIALPAHCPPGDFRGITYRTRDLRTGKVWEAKDSPQDCGDR